MVEKCLEREDYKDLGISPLCSRCLPALKRMGVSERAILDYRWERVERAFKEIGQRHYIALGGMIVNRAVYFGR